MVTEAVKPMADDVAGNDNGAVTDSRSLVDSLVASGALDPLFERIDGGQIALTGDGGLLGELTRVALERGLQAEMTSHLGYAPGDRESKAGGRHANSRNGSYPKTLSTPVGEVTVQVPRDRDGSFTPRLVPKHSRRLGGLDEMIISLYAGGMTVRDIQHHLEKTIGTDLSPETISNITGAVSDAVLEWQERPLDEFYPVLYLDAVRVKVRDNGRVLPKAAHIAIGVDMDGFKHVLGIWVQDNEGASFWAHVCAEMANRGMADALIVCCGGLKGLPEAVEATWPKAIVQTCVVHLIRAANRFVADHDRKSGAQERVLRVQRAGRGKGARRVRGKRARPEIPVGGRHVETLVGPVRPVPAVPAHAPPGGVHHQQHRIAQLPAAQGQPQPQPVPQRPGRGQAVLAGNLRHRGQTQPQTRQRRQQNQAQKRGKAHRGAHNDQLETGPRPTRGRIPRTNGTLFIKHTPNTNNLTSSLFWTTSI